MAKGVSLSFLQGQGVDDLLRVFDRMDPKEQKKIATKVTRAGAKVMVPTIKSLAPIDFEGERDGKHLVDTIKVKALKRSRNTVGSWVRTGSASELGIAPDEGYYPAHVELGFTRKDGSTVPAQSYMRAGFDIKKEAAFKVMGVGLFKELKKKWLAK